MVGSGCRCDEVSNGFRLAEVHLAIEEGPFGVFPRACHTASRSKKKLHDTAKDIGRTVAGDFRAVLARVGMWATEETDEHFVNGLPVRGVDDLAEGERAARFVFERSDPFRAEYAGSGGDGVLTRYADNAEGTACRSGDCTNGLHRKENLNV